MYFHSCSTDQLYSFSRHGAAVCNELHELPKNWSKLSLFRSYFPELQRVEEDENFNSVLYWFAERCDKESENVIFYFNKRISENFLIWEIYSNNASLSEWVKEIKSNHSHRQDFILWPNEQLKSPKLLVFDMDSTFIQIEVIDELARRYGVGESVSKVTEAAMRGELDFSESLISRVACLKGLAERVIEEIAQALPLSLGVDELVSQCEKSGVKIAVVSGGFTPFVEHLKNTMGLFAVKANDLEVENGQLTGKVLGNIVDAKAKADFVKQLQQELNLNSDEIMTIGDGANDLLMMRESEFSLAYNAKPAVVEAAKGKMSLTKLSDLINVFDYKNVNSL